MQVFIVAVSIALVVSFMCSIFESVLLSISHAQVELLVERGKRSGRILKAFKERIDVPISAILITNTAAHTVGTAVAGASYADTFSAETLSSMRRRSSRSTPFGSLRNRTGSAPARKSTPWTRWTL